MFWQVAHETEMDYLGNRGRGNFYRRLLLLRWRNNPHRSATTRPVEFEQHVRAERCVQQFRVVCALTGDAFANMNLLFAGGIRNRSDLKRSERRECAGFCSLGACPG